MSSNQSDFQDPAFQTPQPSQLQSEENKASVRERLSEEQGAETDVVDDRATENDIKPTDPVEILNDIDKLENRHLPSLDSPPG